MESMKDTENRLEAERIAQRDAMSLNSKKWLMRFISEYQSNNISSLLSNLREQHITLEFDEDYTSDEFDELTLNTFIDYKQRNWGDALDKLLEFTKAYKLLVRCVKYEVN